jgi:hypothetical protein
MKRIPGIHYDYMPEKKDNPIAEYVKSSKRVFESGSQRDDDTNKPLVNHLDAYVRMRFGYLLRMGANKYDKNNWQKGQPDESSLESLHRHLAKYELGDRSEDHLGCILFGIQLIMKNEQKAGIAVDHYYKPIENENNS